MRYRLKEGIERVQIRGRIVESGQILEGPEWEEWTGKNGLPALLEPVPVGEKATLAASAQGVLPAGDEGDATKKDESGGTAPQDEPSRVVRRRRRGRPRKRDA